MIQGHAQTHDYPRLDELAAFREQYGYDPLRFLWTSSVDGQATGEGDSPELATAYSLIAGITDRWELAWWFFAEFRTRRREHVYRRLRQRDIAIVDGGRRFAGTTEYPWERASAVPPEDAALIADDSATSKAASTEGRTHEAQTVASDSPSSLGRCPDCEHSVTEEHLAGEIGYWCPNCSDFVATSRDELVGGVAGGDAVA